MAAQIARVVARTVLVARMAVAMVVQIALVVQPGVRAVEADVQELAAADARVHVQTDALDAEDAQAVQVRAQTVSLETVARVISK